MQALKDFLPVDAKLNIKTVQNHTLAVAERCEAELGEERWAFVEGCPADWETLPIPDGPITVGIDGGYVRSWEEKQQHFEVIVGKSILAFHGEEEEDLPSSKCFGFVQTLDEKPKRRLFEVLKSQGLQMNQQLTFLSDGGDTVRDLQLYMSPEAEHLLDWFHLSMRLTVLQQSAKSLPLARFCANFDFRGDIENRVSAILTPPDFGVHSFRPPMEEAMSRLWSQLG